MNFNLLLAAVEFAKGQAVTHGTKIEKCPSTCRITDCLKSGVEVYSNCLQDEIKQLEILERQLFALKLRSVEQQSWQHLDSLDNAIHNLQLHQQIDADSDDRQIVIILNQQPHIIDFNPASANDIQRLLHRQIAMHYADDIE